MSKNNQNNEIWSWTYLHSDYWNHGTFNSREEAIEDALATKKAFHESTETILVSKCETAPLPTYVDSEDILNNLDEQYHNETGSEDYLYEGVTKEQTKWLEDKLSELMVEFHKKIGLKSSWYTILGPEEVNLNEYEEKKHNTQVLSR